MKFLVRIFGSLIVAILYDPKEIAKAMQERKHDDVTGVYSRSYVVELARKALAYALRYNRPISFAVIDLDGFKRFNDARGHPAGDRLLKDFAQRVRALLRSPDSIGRMGGDEFFIVLPEANEGAVEEALKRIREDKKLKEIPFSFGIASVVRGDTFEAMYERADDAMYEEKRSRGGLC